MKRIIPCLKISAHPIPRKRCLLRPSLMNGLLLGLLLGLLPCIAKDSANTGSATAEVLREPLFDGPVLHWEVQVRRADLAKLRKSGGPWNRENDEDASATVRAGGQVWTNVAIHL